jgi:predicted TIM-barrel fold metal-dependent hydrolase
LVDNSPQATIFPDRLQPHFLDNAERETARRKLWSVPIIDCDSHVYESTSYPEILQYMENENIRRTFANNPMEAIATFMVPQTLGDRSAGGRISAAQHGIDAKGVREEASSVHPVAATALYSMETMGIDYTILFPTPMLSLGLTPQHDVELDLSWAFNRWLTEDVLPADKRLCTMPYLPLSDPDACVRYIEEFGSRPGVLGFMVTAVRHQAFTRNQYMKVFAALNERKLPLAFHSGPNWVEQPFTTIGRFLGAHALGFPLYAMTTLTNVVIAGLPERFPDIDWIFMEAGQAWVPFVMARLDNEYKQRPSDAPLLRRLPSDYIRKMYFTTQPFETHRDPQHMRAIHEMMNGAESLLFASDYPHPDFDHPALIWDQQWLSEDEKRAILGGNASKLFDLPELPRRPEPEGSQAAAESLATDGATR